MGDVKPIPFWMDDEKRRHIAKLCQKIIDAVEPLADDPVEVFIAMKECLTAWGEKFNIRDVEMFENPTERLQ